MGVAMLRPTLAVLFAVAGLGVASSALPSSREKSGHLHVEDGLRGVKLDVSSAFTRRGLRFGWIKADMAGGPALTREGLACHIESDYRVDATITAQALTADGAEVALDRQRVSLRPSSNDPGRQYVRFRFMPSLDPAKTARILIGFEE